MIKITNEDAKGHCSEYTIALSSVRGGVLLEVDEYASGVREGSSVVLITPTSAAKLAYELEQSDGLGCSPVCPRGHDFWVRKILSAEDVSGRRCLEYPAEVIIKSDDIMMFAPRFVTYALAETLKDMMASLLLPKVGEMK